MLLAPYQKAVLREAYRRKDDGKFVYDVVCWSDIKKSIKSSIAAAVILHRALETEWGSFKVVANDLKQADSRVFYYLSRAATLNTRLSERITTRNYRITVDNHSVIEAIPVDPKGEAGGNDDLIEWTELHAANGKAADGMWSEMTLSPTKHGYSQRWIDTYAGESGNAPTLERLYNEGVKNGRRLDLSYTEDGVFYDLSDLEVYANGSLLVLWNTTPRLPWQTPEYYAEEEAILLPNQFARMHRNQWRSGSESFIQIEWWDACALDALSPLLPHQMCVIGLDAAIKRDCFGVVLVSKIQRDGVDILQVRASREWRPPKGGDIEFESDDKDDPNTPGGYIRALCKQFPVAEVAYDPAKVEFFCKQLAKEGLGAHFREFSQQGDRAVADKGLQQLILQRRIQHDGTHHDLRRHLANADAKTDGERNLRIVKRNDDGSLPNDLAVALSQASARALHLNIG